MGVVKYGFQFKFKNLNAFLYLFSNKMYVVRAGIHKMLVRIANREDPDLIWVCPACLDLFDRQLVIEIHHMEITCVDPESFVRGGPNLITFFIFF